MNSAYKLIFGFFVILCFGLLSSCADQGYIQLSSKPRLVPAAAASALSELAGNNNQFAFEMYKQLGEGQTDNLFFSPYSISQGLVMVYAGARGETATQIASTLHFAQPDEKLHSEFNALNQKLTGSTVPSADFQLKIANAAWGQHDYKFLPSFLDVLAQYYGTGVRTTDFNDTTKAVNAINQWTKNATDGKIDRLISELSPDTRLVLANAIYLNAKWEDPFKAWGEGDFHPLSGGTRKVPMMRYKPSHDNNNVLFLYVDGPSYQVVSLPYRDDHTEMVILLPAAGKFQQIEANLTSAWVQKILEQRQMYVVTLTMPKFRLEPPTIMLKPALSALGMRASFSRSDADFSGMDGERELFLDEIIQKTYIQVNEEGTEAAAATGMVFETISGVLGSVDMVVDRPFIFFIRDIETGTILFLGRVTDLPSS